MRSLMTEGDMKRRESRLSLEKLVALPFQALGAPSPDGKKVAFVSNRSGRCEIHVVNLDTLEIAQLSHGEYPDTMVDWHKWSSDGSYLIFPKDRVPGVEKYDLFKITYPEGKVTELTNTPDAMDVYGTTNPNSDVIAFFSDRTGITQLYTMNLDGTNVKQISHEKTNAYYLSDFYWSPDGEWITFTRFNLENPLAYDVWIVKSDGSEEKKLISLKDGSKEIVNGWMIDSSAVLFTSDSSGVNRAGLYYLESNEIKWFGTGQYPEDGRCITSDGSQVIVVRYIDAEIKISAYDISTGVETSLELPPGLSGTRYTALDGRHLLVGHQNSTHAMRFILYDFDNHNYKEVIPAEYHDFVPERDFHPDEYISYPSENGVTIHAILYKPKDIEPGEKLPALVHPHGGPTGQFLRMFMPYIQIFVDRGYVMLLPNVHGSTGYGAEFRDACIKDWGGKDLVDIEKGVEYLRTLDYVDPDRIGIHSISYGGYLTYMAVTKKPELWKAASAVNGITHLKTLYEESKEKFPLLTTYFEQQMGKPDNEEILALWEDRSPANFAGNLKAKLQIIHAVNDPRCPLTQAEIFKDNLLKAGRREGVDFEYVVLEEQGHWSDDISQQLQYYKHLLKFLEENL